MTHVALICDDPVVQAVLPQFLLGNERTLPIHELAALRASCRPNVHIVRQKSAWGSHLVGARIAWTLRAALEPHMDGYQPVLLLDTVKFQYGQTVLAACRRAGIWVILVPLRLTWLLQPGRGSFGSFLVLGWFSNYLTRPAARWVRRMFFGPKWRHWRPMFDLSSDLYRFGAMPKNHCFF
jgi:hypothetical protein